VKVLRIAGIAIGSLVAAGLVVWLVRTVLVGDTTGAATAIVTFVLGGLIFVDIMSRERSKP